MKIIAPARNPVLVAVHAQLPKALVQVCADLAALDDGQRADPAADMGVPTVQFTVRLGHSDTVRAAASLLASGYEFDESPRYLLRGKTEHVQFPVTYTQSRYITTWGDPQSLVTVHLGYHPLKSVAQSVLDGHVDVVDLVAVARHLDQYVASSLDAAPVPEPAWDYVDCGLLINRVGEAIDAIYTDMDLVDELAVRSSEFRRLVAMYADQWIFHLSAIDEVVMASAVEATL